MVQVEGELSFELVFIFSEYIGERIIVFEYI